MANTPSNRLRPSDRERIDGLDVIVQPEIPQLIPPPIVPDTEPEPTSAQRLEDIRASADNLITRINSLIEKVDSRCQGMQISSSEPAGSPLFQAMVRVFGERTTTVTYDHYKRALAIREQLAEEDSAKLREK